MKKIAIAVLYFMLAVPAAYADNAEPRDMSAVRATVAAVADIAEFDIKNYDYDRIFRYALYTHNNFRILTDIDPMEGESSSMGYNKISLVSSEYMDYVMTDVLGITPEKPPISDLINRGFCYNNGYYLYTGGFNTFFATEINDIDSAELLGGGVFLVTFSDVYTEGNNRTAEQSYAVLLERDDNTYTLLRLGMGQDVPDTETLMSYVPTPRDDSVPREATENNDRKALLPFLLLVCGAGIVGVILCLTILVRSKK